MTTSIERLLTIEQERTETQNSPEFQEWIRDLNVSRMLIKDQEGLDNAREMNSQYTLSKHKYAFNINE